MKKIIMLAFCTIILTGCQKEDYSKIKKAHLENCEDLTFEENINNYLKNASWEKDNDTFIINGKNNNKEKVSIKVTLKDNKVNIQKLVVDKVIKTNELEPILAIMCPNNKPKEEEQKKDDLEKQEEEKPEEKPAASINESIQHIKPKENIKEPMVVVPAEPEKNETPALKPIEPNIEPNPEPEKEDIPTAVNQITVCNINYRDEDFLYRESVRINAENDDITNLESTMIIEIGLEVTDEIYNLLEEAFNEFGTAKGLTREYGRQSTTSVYIKHILNVKEADFNNSADREVIESIFGEIDYKYNNTVKYHKDYGYLCS